MTIYEGNRIDTFSGDHSNLTVASLVRDHTGNALPELTEHLFSALLENSVFYPASSADGEIIVGLGEAFNSFVYVDWDLRPNDLVRLGRPVLDGLPIFPGFTLRASRILTARETFGIARWPRRNSFHSSCSPGASWARWLLLDLPNGGRTVSVILIGHEGIDAFRRTYVRLGRSPDVVVVKNADTGFGGWNHTNFSDPHAQLATIAGGQCERKPMFLAHGGYPSNDFFAPTCWSWFGVRQHVFRGNLFLWRRGVAAFKRTNDPVIEKDLRDIEHYFHQTFCARLAQLGSTGLHKGDDFFGGKEWKNAIFDLKKVPATEMPFFILSLLMTVVTDQCLFAKFPDCYSDWSRAHPSRKFGWVGPTVRHENPLFLLTEPERLNAQGLLAVDVPEILRMMPAFTRFFLKELQRLCGHVNPFGDVNGPTIYSFSREVFTDSDFSTGTNSKLVGAFRDEYSISLFS